MDFLHLPYHLLYGEAAFCLILGEIMGMEGDSANLIRLYAKWLLVGNKDGFFGRSGMELPLHTDAFHTRGRCSPQVDLYGDGVRELVGVCADEPAGGNRVAVELGGAIQSGAIVGENDGLLRPIDWKPFSGGVGQFQVECVGPIGLAATAEIGDGDGTLGQVCQGEEGILNGLEITGAATAEEGGLSKSGGPVKGNWRCRLACHPSKAENSDAHGGNRPPWQSWIASPGCAQ